jgi:hypothetical protein
MVGKWAAISGSSGVHHRKGLTRTHLENGAVDNNQGVAVDGNDGREFTRSSVLLGWSSREVRCQNELEHEKSFGDRKNRYL